MNRFYKTVVCVLKPILKCLFKFEITGADNIKDASKVLLCCNHQSFWDIVILMCVCPRQINFMAKKELFKFAPIGFIFKKLGAFPVNRAVGDLTAVKHAEQLLNKDEILGIFPEGTRNKLGAPQRAKAGAAMLALNTGAGILPVAIRYSKKPLIFKKVRINIGKKMDIADVTCNNTISKTEIKRVTGIIMENITKLWETAI